VENTPRRLSPAKRHGLCRNHGPIHRHGDRHSNGCGREERSFASRPSNNEEAQLCELDTLESLSSSAFQRADDLALFKSPNPLGNHFPVIVQGDITERWRFIIERTDDYLR
jgi:hypothetical protein